jgi:hypothetical protein
MGWLGNFPKLTVKMIQKNWNVSSATAMGYLDLTRQGQNSTRRRPKATVPADEHQRDPSHIVDANDASNMCFQVFTRDEFFNSSDATGRFPVLTASGWEYILVSTLNGYVHLELLKKRNASEYLRAYKAMHTFYESHGK